MDEKLRALLKEDQLDLLKGEGKHTWVRQKLALWKKRKVTLLQVIIKDYSIHEDRFHSPMIEVRFQFVLRQNGHIYIEESIESKRIENGLLEAVPTTYPVQKKAIETVLNYVPATDIRNFRFVYDRRAAVRYAEKWWDSYNPAYQHFEVDCTNYISQCLKAGGFPMNGYPNRSRGWWYQSNTWSFSWSVANALLAYLTNPSTSGVLEVKKQTLLLPGDVICYDFEGDGRYNHSTIVVAKDQNGEPLVNAHTSNSRMRYWNYEDSTAYTPNIRYRFYTIEGNPQRAKE
jgi:hypothetical protein